MSHQEHKAHGPASVACFVLTVSDTRTAESDTSGRAIRELLEAAGHRVSGEAIVRDGPSRGRGTVLARCASGGTQGVITTGGTGVTSRDGPYEGVSGLLGERLAGV